MKQHGQSLVEFAIAMPLFALVVLVTIQFSLLCIWYFSETNMARESARWLAVRSDTLDADFAAHVQASMLPGLVGGTPSLLSSTSSETDYRVGRMTVRFSACVPDSSTPPRCTNADRAPGATLFVEMAYDASNIIFLPTTFQLPGIGANSGVAIPTSLPAYRLWVMNE